MRKNKKSYSISELCRNNNFRTLEFYRMPRRHPELARKMKANSAGERVLDKEEMRTARESSWFHTMTAPKYGSYGTSRVSTLMFVAL